MDSSRAYHPLRHCQVPATRNPPPTKPPSRSPGRRQSAKGLPSNAATSAESSQPWGAAASSTPAITAATPVAISTETKTRSLPDRRRRDTATPRDRVALTLPPPAPTLHVAVATSRAGLMGRIISGPYSSLPPVTGSQPHVGSRNPCPRRTSRALSGSRDLRPALIHCPPMAEPWAEQPPTRIGESALLPRATCLCGRSWSEPQLSVQCTHTPPGHHREARVGREKGSFIGMRPGLEPQNADTLRDRLASHSQCFCRRAEDVDHVDRHIDVFQRRVDPRTEDFAASRVHRDDLVPLRLQITRDLVRSLGPIGGGSDHCDRFDPLVDSHKFLGGKMSHAVHRLASLTSSTTARTFRAPMSFPRGCGRRTGSDRSRIPNCDANA